MAQTVRQTKAQTLNQMVLVQWTHAIKWVFYLLCILRSTYIHKQQ